MAHDSAAEQYGEGRRAMQTAYAALKFTHEKVGDHWEKKDSPGPSHEQGTQMTDQTPWSAHPDPSDEVKQLAADSIGDLGNGQAAASVPGASGHEDLQRRREVVDTVFEDPRIHGADHVSVTVPRGDTEALDQVRSRLLDEHTRSAGSTVIIEGRPSGGASGTGEGSNPPQRPKDND